MPRPPKPLTMEEQQILLKFVGYDAKQDRLVWMPRDPKDFGTRDQERTARGFNAAKAGQPVALTAVGSFGVTTHATRYVFSENKVRAFFGAPHAPIRAYAQDEVTLKSRTPRHSHARGNAALNTNPDGNLFSQEIIRMLMSVGQGGRLEWNTLDRDAWARLREVYLHLSPAAEYDAQGQMTEHGRRVYNGKRAGRPVQVTTAGVVRVLAVIRISPFVIEKLFPGARLGVTEKPAARPMAFPDTLLRDVCRRNPEGLPVWKERGLGVWQKLELFGFVKGVPSAERIETWNVENVGTKVPISAAANRAACYRIGRRTVSLGRMRAAIG